MTFALDCAFCARPFSPSFKGQRFCRHACYSASLRRPVAPRFWAKVDPAGPVHPVLGTPCWLWRGALAGSNRRYGQVMWRAKYRTPQRAHRIAWELTHGPISPDQQINHHCDNPICCNPAHLYLGTQADNMRDASARARFTVPRTRTLSLHERLLIYRTPLTRGSGVALARQFGVTEAAISVIRKGRFIGSGRWFGTKVPALLQELERTHA